MVREIESSKCLVTFTNEIGESSVYFDEKETWKNSYLSNINSLVNI